MGFKIHAALILVSVLFGVNYVFSKYVLEFLPPGAWALTRVILTAFFLSLIAIPGFRAKRPTGRQWLTLAAISIFGVVINQISFYEGLERTTPTHAAIINTTIPMFTLFFSLVFRQERLNGMRLLGMALSIVGVLVVLEIEKQKFVSALFLGDCLNLLNSMSFGLYLVISRNISRELHPLVVTAGMFLFGTIGMSFYGFHSLLAVTWVGFPLMLYFAMAVIVFGASVGTYSLNNWALSKTDSTMVALYIYIQPIVAGFLSRILYHEEITLRMIVASLLVFTGVAVGSVLPAQRRPRVAT